MGRVGQSSAGLASHTAAKNQIARLEARMLPQAERRQIEADVRNLMPVLNTTALDQESQSRILATFRKWRDRDADFQRSGLTATPCLDYLLNQTKLQTVRRKGGWREMWVDHDSTVFDAILESLDSGLLAEFERIVASAAVESSVDRQVPATENAWKSVGKTFALEGAGVVEGLGLGLATGFDDLSGGATAGIQKGLDLLHVDWKMAKPVSTRDFLANQQDQTNTQLRNWLGANRENTASILGMMPDEFGRAATENLIAPLMLAGLGDELEDVKIYKTAKSAATTAQNILDLGSAILTIRSRAIELQKESPTDWHNEVWEDPQVIESVGAVLERFGELAGAAVPTKQKYKAVNLVLRRIKMAGQFTESAGKGATQILDATQKASEFMISHPKADVLDALTAPGVLDDIVQVVGSAAQMGKASSTFGKLKGLGHLSERLAKISKFGNSVLEAGHALGNAFTTEAADSFSSLFGSKSDVFQRGLAQSNSLFDDVWTGAYTLFSAKLPHDGELTGPFLPGGLEPADADEAAKLHGKYDAKTRRAAIGRGAVVFVNGQTYDLLKHSRAAQGLATTMGRPVVGVYTATNGGLNDTIQSIGLKFGWTRRMMPSVETLVGIIKEFGDAKGGDSKTGNFGALKLVGHSQGTIVIEEARRIALSEGADTSKEDITTYGNAIFTQSDVADRKRRQETGAASAVGGYRHLAYEGDGVTRGVGGLPIGGADHGFPVLSRMARWLTPGSDRIGEDSVHHLAEPPGMNGFKVAPVPGETPVDEGEHGLFIIREQHDRSMLKMEQHSLWNMDAADRASNPDYIRATQNVVEEGWEAHDRANKLPDAEQVTNSVQALLQKKAVRSNHDSNVDPASLQQRLLKQEGLGQALDTGSIQRLEGHLGADLSNMRVHSGAASSEASRSLGARAFTIGEHVFFGEGEYQPSTNRGLALVAHEATHVVQQGNLAVQGYSTSGGDAMEVEARKNEALFLAAASSAQLDVGRVETEVVAGQGSGIPAQEMQRIERLRDAAIAKSSQQMPSAAGKTIDHITVELDLDPNESDASTVTRWSAQIVAAVLSRNTEHSNFAIPQVQMAPGRTPPPLPPRPNTPPPLPPRPPKIEENPGLQGVFKPSLIYDRISPPRGWSVAQLGLGPYFNKKIGGFDVVFHPSLDTPKFSSVEFLKADKQPDPSGFSNNYNRLFDVKGNPFIHFGLTKEIASRDNIRYEDQPNQPIFSPEHKLSVADVRQGQIGDCYLLAAMISVVNNNPDFFPGIMRESGKTYTTTLFAPDTTGVWVKKQITLDKKLPSKKRAGENDKSSPLWPAYLEKAYIALGYSYQDKKTGPGSYLRSDGGFENDAIRVLTGQDYKSFSVGDFAGSSQALKGPGRNRELGLIDRLFGRTQTSETLLDVDIRRDTLLQPSEFTVLKTFLLASPATRAAALKDPGGPHKLAIPAAYRVLDQNERLLSAWFQFFDKFRDSLLVTNTIEEILRVFKGPPKLDSAVEDRLLPVLKTVYPSRPIDGPYGLDALRMYDSIKKALADKRFVTAATDEDQLKKTFRQDKTSADHPEGQYRGIVGGHAYAVLGVKSDTIAGFGNRYITLRNPWGSYTRKYESLDGATTPKAAQEGGSAEQGSKVQPGVFDVELNDFVRCFTRVALPPEVV